MNEIGIRMNEIEAWRAGPETANLALEKQPCDWWQNLPNES